ncbi:MULTISPECIES: type II secretion system F family protein [unclassified Roseateles]|uniref:type II secretion system F family protein n=1 Tax=unclassified Roseateles TaxID=2626991 RepID=UPI0006FD9623|nr:MULTISPECIES: type II secretion system F family protein [unclassified Roseateles]KQW43571.1 MSHA biogenesis protein MshG [Pelomonas sp. Root405]KRA71309.1 MSHA biogenesis protein MshG [Pelomonas sp. Root662]
MSNFSFKGRNGRGELVEGIVDAVNSDAVAAQLMSGGVVPVSIEATTEAISVAGGSNWLEALLARSISMDDTLVLTRQMYTLQKAGVPILRSLAGLEASTTHPAIVSLLQDVRASLDQGRELATAFARHPAVFSPFFIAMTRVGELTGKLTEVFQRLAEHLEFEIDIRARIKQALRYPIMVMLAMGIALVVINLFVLPKFADVFAHFKTELPLMTRILLGFSTWTVKWWPLVLAGGIGAVLAWRNWVATPGGRYTWDRFKLRLPIAGNIVLKATLARFARSFALASSSGVPISQAMTVVAQTVDNAYIGARIEQMRDGVERGESISRCATATGVFTPIVLQMIAVGEETGELDTLMTEIAQMYERETDYAIKGLSAAIEPILLAIIGALVLVLALGVFLPLWNLGQAAQGR